MAWSPTTTGVATSLYGVWAAGTNDVWAVGDTGLILRWNGSGWATVASGITEAIVAIWGTGATDIWAVAEGPTFLDPSRVLHWNGSAWAVADLPTTYIPRSIFGFDTDDVWAVGDNGTRLHWDGATWSIVDPGVSVENLRGVWGSATNDVWAVGENGTTLYWDGVAWAVFANGLGLTDTFTGIYGFDTGSIIAIGDSGVAAHWDGAAWALANSTGGDPRFKYNLTGIYWNPLVLQDVWIVGQGMPFFLHVAGDLSEFQPVTEDDGYSKTWPGGFAVFAVAVDDAWAVSSGGVAYHWNGPGSSAGGVAPVVTLISPADTTQLDPDSPVVVEVTCSTELKRAILIATDAALKLSEVVHDGDGFGQLYSASAANSRLSIADGYRYSFVRQGGWPQGTTLVLKVIAYDRLGVEV